MKTATIRVGIKPVISCAAAMLFLFFACVPAAISFSIPERLEYDLTWAGIKAGDAVLEVKNDGSNIQFISKANSAKWVSIFYKVEDVVVSILRRTANGDFNKKFAGIPYNYKIKLREGRRKKDREIILDHASKKATYINYLNKEKRVFSITETTLDPLSSFYYIRTLPLEVGKSVYVEIFDSKKIYKAEVQVLKKEIVETPAGIFNTILIKPLIKSEGIFYRRGDLFIWLTDDDRRIPVMLKTKVSLGAVKAVLAGGRY